MNSLRRIAAVATVEWARLLRTRIALTLLLVVPLLQIVLFGTAIRPDTAVAVAIAAPTASDAETVAKELRKQRNIMIVGTGKPGTAEALVKRGGAVIGIEVPEARSFANPLAKGGPLRIVVDESNAALASAATARIEAAYWRTLAERGDLAGPGLTTTRLYNPDSRADWSFLPGLIGVTVMIAMIMLGSLSLAREAQRSEHDHRDHHRDPDQTRQEAPVGARVRIVEPRCRQPRPGEIAALRKGAPVRRLDPCGRRRCERRIALIDHDAQRTTLGERIGEGPGLRNLDPDDGTAAFHQRLGRSGFAGAYNHYVALFAQFLGHGFGVACRWCGYRHGDGGIGPDRGAEQHDL